MTALEPVPTPVLVHRTGISSISVPVTDGQPVLYPVLAVWADLSPMRAAGLTFGSGQVGLLPLVRSVAAFVDSESPAVTTLVVSQSTPPEPDSEPVLKQGTTTAEQALLSQPVGVGALAQFALRLPTTWLAMTTAMVDTPWQMRMVLIDGEPPLDASLNVLTFEEVVLAVIPDRTRMQEALQTVMGKEWTMRTNITMNSDADQPVMPVNLMRDQMWTLIAGVALGHERALNRLYSFAAFIEADPDRFAEAQPPTEWIAESSMLEPLRRDESGKVRWPSPMLALRERLDSEVHAGALDALDNGRLVEEVHDAFGVLPTIVALCVAAAAKAHYAADGDPDNGVLPSRFTATYLIGAWLDEEAEIPLWATRATHSLLMHHDTDVLVDLLSSTGATTGQDGSDGMLTHRFFHATVEALWALGMDSDQITGAAAGLDFLPPNIDDVLFVSDRLLSTARQAAVARRDECAPCVAITEVVAEITDQSRLIRAVVTTLPVLADLSAARAGLPVGEEDWREHRSQYLKHWLTRTALHPSVDA